jgi:hypothetical protein
LSRFHLTRQTAAKSAALALIGVCVGILARGQSASPSNGSRPPVSLTTSAERAKPPTWTADVLDAFFDDARTVLAGPRPDYAAKSRAGGETAASAAPQTARPDATAWSKLIDAETLETEIKRLAQAVATSVTTPGQFKGGGNRACRRDFALLAVLFAATAEYDAAIRWQDAAPGLRELFTRAARNAKVGSDQSYNEAAARKRELEELVRGSRPQLPPAERAAVWGQVAERSALMQRLNAAYEERLTKWTANEREFANRRADVRHEAQIIALLADVISREGFDYWDEADYAKFVRELRAAAVDAAAAAKANNYQDAGKAIDRAGKACAGCHEVYRG